ncbi:cilia- and flagella-associated protein 418 isoform X1 [Sphaerodactylus townsendi]|uniref:cilia- and flagella-associated protein 418 isoform X1 n=1 Tax=Sphaerodactylus townsendi TaxID=933632 RepID=UPI0020274461|nr:cilia- and flagella-associated protein 418 isoform X1 [Sphaerodactylus townsendi]
MAEDLDQLLDEVEDRFCRLSKRDCPDGFRTQGEKNNNPSEAPETAKAASSVKRAWISKNSTKHDNEEEDLDEIINDIISENNFAKNHVKCISKSSSLTAETNVTSSHAHDKRCCPVYLGGSTAPCGIGTNISQKTCDRLRCTACDFRVLHHDDYQWDTSCDYLFFRNNMPEFSKLRTKMVKKKGTRAYACQCSWRSIDELTDLSTDRQLRWVCSKHAE